MVENFIAFGTAAQTEKVVAVALREAHIHTAGRGKRRLFVGGKRQTKVWNRLC